MGRKTLNLALAFLQMHPKAAANVLEKQPAEDVATFLINLPSHYASAVLENMLPQYTARLCALMDTKRVATYLSKMKVSLVAAILRHSGKEVRKKLLEVIPKKTAIACKFLLNYPKNAVGAWMVANVITLPDDCNVAEALERLALEEESTDVDTIYIVDRDRNLRGIISTRMLLRATPETGISTIMQPKPNTISGRASLASIKNHDGWKAKDVLPVINRNKQLVGMLRHVDLRKGLDSIESTIDAPPQENNDPINNIYHAYGESLLTLLGTFGGITNPKGGELTNGK